MDSLWTVAIALVGLGAAVGCAGVVYRDATRLEVSRPALWAGFVFVTCGGGVALYLAPPSVPIPGLLVIVLAGPALYLFERDDARHGDDPADPHSLPDAPGGDASSDGSNEE